MRYLHVSRARSNLIVKTFNLLSQPNIVRRNFKLLGKPVWLSVPCVYPSTLPHRRRSPCLINDLSPATHNADLGMDECPSSISSAISINLRKDAFKALT